MKTPSRQPQFNSESNTPVTRRHTLLLGLGLLAASVLTLCGCARGQKSTGNQDIAGTYALVSVDGKAIPATVNHDGTAIQVRAGRFSIGPEGTCGTHTVFVPPKGGEVARDVEATYTRKGAELTMRWKGAGITRGTVEGDTFRMNNEGMIFVYRK